MICRFCGKDGAKERMVGGQATVVCAACARRLDQCLTDYAGLMWGLGDDFQGAYDAILGKILETGKIPDIWELLKSEDGKGYFPEIKS